MKKTTSLFLVVMILVVMSGCSVMKSKPTFDNKNQLRKSPCACLELAHG